MRSPLGTIVGREDLPNVESPVKGSRRRLWQTLEMFAPSTTPTVAFCTPASFKSRRFRAACKDHRLRQEFITLYTPEQNGMIERFFRSLKEEFLWQHGFPSFVEGRRAVRRDRMVTTIDDVAVPRVEIRHDEHTLSTR